MKSLTILKDWFSQDARKTYSEKVIDHFMNPRNLGALENPDCFNAMSGICGDTIGIYVGLDDDKIARISFVTNGCGPTIACSSALTCMAKGLQIQEAMKITRQGSDAVPGRLAGGAYPLRRPGGQHAQKRPCKGKVRHETAETPYRHP